jgi:hypothetical protein
MPPFSSPHTSHPTTNRIRTPSTTRTLSNSAFPAPKHSVEYLCFFQTFCTQAPVVPADPSQGALCLCPVHSHIHYLSCVCAHECRAAAKGIVVPRSRKFCAVPFVGKDVPSPASEFSFPDIVIGLSILAYRYQVGRATPPPPCGNILHTKEHLPHIALRIERRVRILQYQ